MMLFSCFKTVRWWSESLDREIPLWRRMLIAIHVVRCGPCARYRMQVLAQRKQVRAHQILEQNGEEDQSASLAPERKTVIVTAMLSKSGADLNN